MGLSQNEPQLWVFISASSWKVNKCKNLLKWKYNGDVLLQMRIDGLSEQILKMRTNSTNSFELNKVSRWKQYTGLKTGDQTN
jgi:hypothetical protein